MKRNTIIGIMLLQVLWICGCSATMQSGNDTGVRIEKPKEEDLKPLIGKKITVTGKTVNVKLGAQLILEGGAIIWMDGMEGWPVGFYEYEMQAKTVKVTGVLIEKHDLPVFIGDENGAIQQGMPIPEGTGIKEASQRYVLKKYKWVAIR